MQRQKSELCNDFNTEGEREKTKAGCRYCSARHSLKGGNTTNLKRRLITRHPTVPVTRIAKTASAPPERSSLSTEVMTIISSSPGPSTSAGKSLPASPPASPPHFNPKPQQTSVADSVSINKPVSIAKSRLIDAQLVKMVAKEFHPFSIVEDKEFVEYSNMLNPGYKLPSRKTISNSLVPAHYNDCRDKVRQLLDRACAVCLTTDAWSSQTCVSFIAVTAHFCLTRETGGKAYSYLLDCSEFPDSASNLSAWLQKTVRKWGIEDKIIAVTTDNAPNVVAAVRQCNWHHIGCYAHTLNLVVQTSLGEIEELLSKVKLAVQHFKKSPECMSKLSEIQVGMGVSELKLIQDVPTRWNSTYAMLERFYAIKDPLLTTIAVMGLNEKINFPNSDWQVIKEAVSILLVFNEATKIMSAEKETTISKVLVLNDMILEHLRLQNISLSSECSRFEAKLQAEMAAKFRDLQHNPLVVQASLLDPRFKRQAFSIENQYKEACSMITELVKEELAKSGALTRSDQATQGAEEKTDAQATCVWQFFDKRVQKLTTELNPSAAAMVEVDKFLSEPLLPRQSDPIIWWTERKFIYPNLWKLAMKRLFIPASSVPCERVFSKAGYLFNEKRSKLNNSKLFMLISLNSNLE